MNKITLNPGGALSLVLKASNWTFLATKVELTTLMAPLS